MREKDAAVLNIDYRRQEIPPYVREIVATHLALEAEDAKQAGQLGYMARALAQASMPHRDPKTDVYERQNGNFRLRMLAGSSAGLPYGTLPRLLVSWVCTEAVLTQSPELVLGESFAAFLKELDLARTGGVRGDITRLRDQMCRLFGTFINAQFCPSAGSEGGRRVKQPVRPAPAIHLRNILLVEDADVWWEAQDPEKTGAWRGTVRLSDKFFKDCIAAPVPVDLRAYKALRSSPLAIDIYTWLAYRMSYLHKPTPVIRWEALMNQFGSGYAPDEQGVRNFKKAFLRELKRVTLLYNKARIAPEEAGVVLFPSPPHVKKLPRRMPPAQGSLF